MKTPLALVLLAALALSGCSVFRRSPTWSSVVASRAEYAGTGEVDAKTGYLEHLHQVLLSAGVPHKVVAYQFHFQNVYSEMGMQTGTAILYRDESTPSNPWWVMDEYHHVPTWLPSWEVDAQLEFFLRRPVEVISVKEFAGSDAGKDVVARAERAPRRPVAHTAREKRFRALFTGNSTKTRAERTARVSPAAPNDTDPLTAPALTGHSAASHDGTDSRATALFRSTHGTEFDSGSSVDRSKMNDLRRRLLNRHQRISQRAE